MNTIGDRVIGSMVNRLAERARRETLPNPKTSAQVMARIREAQTTAGQGEDVSTTAGGGDQIDFRSLLEAQMRKRG